MALILDRTVDRYGWEASCYGPRPVRERLDVTDVPADRLPAFVEETADTDRVGLERCGNRTVLVVER
jgi:hypothetical protein